MNDMSRFYVVWYPLIILITLFSDYIICDLLNSGICYCCRKIGHDLANTFAKLEKLTLCKSAIRFVTTKHL